MKYYTDKLIADDWGISPGVNEGIETLISLGTVKIVSVLADGEYVSCGLNNLIEKYPNIKFSLHFNLTFNKKTDSICKVIFSYFTNGISKNLILNEFKRQLNICESLGIKISMLDGHHHVHLLPFVFNAIKNEACEREIKEYRVMYDKSHLPTFMLSKIHLIFVNESRMKKILVGYLRKKDLINREKFKEKCDRYKALICHPATINDFNKFDIKDNLRAERVFEFNKILEILNEK